jgi:hypothetical protein
MLLPVHNMSKMYWFRLIGEIETKFDFLLQWGQEWSDKNWEGPNKKIDKKSV